jgi:hypothetical protein
VHLHSDLHAVLKECSPLSNLIRGKLDLSIGFEIHEDERVALYIKKTEILELEIDRLDRLVGAEGFVEFARVDEIFQFHLVERATLADDGAERNPGFR